MTMPCPRCRFQDLEILKFWIAFFAFPSIVLEEIHLFDVVFDTFKTKFRQLLVWCHLLAHHVPICKICRLFLKGFGQLFTWLCEPRFFLFFLNVFEFFLHKIQSWYVVQNYFHLNLCRDQYRDQELSILPCLHPNVKPMLSGIIWMLYTHKSTCTPKWHFLILK